MGLRKAERLAEERGVRIRTRCSDLMAYEIGEGKWDVIVSYLCH